MSSTTPSGTVSAAATTASSGGAAMMHSWEDSGEHVWQGVHEDENGNIVVADSELSVHERIRQRRKLLERQDYTQKHRRVVRDMIRYVYVVVDASRWMRSKDPLFAGARTRMDAAVAVWQDFCTEYYDQNPVSHLGFVVIQNGEAEILSSLSGSARTHKLALQSLADACASEGPNAGGEYSLQNGLEVAGRSLGHQPRHGSREIVVVTAALSTCDPGSILTETLPRLQAAHIRVSCLAITAEMHVCRKLTELTDGSMGVCLDAQHFRDWIMQQCTPPPSSNTNQGGSVCEMMSMGFPARTVSETAELVHAGRQTTLLTRTAYSCPQCLAKNSELPTECAVCGLKLVLAPHLARSFHHLFPVPPFVECSLLENNSTSLPSTLSSAAPPVASSSNTNSISNSISNLDSKLLVDSKDDDRVCYSCLKLLELSFQCPECQNLFCVDCDAYLHESLHNCPGCLSKG